MPRLRSRLPRVASLAGVACSLCAALACGPRITVETVDAPVDEAPVEDGGKDPGPSPEREAVLAVARGYADALTQRDPERAAELVVAETFVFYDDLRRAALTSKAEDLERWPLMPLIMVLELRVRFSRAELEAFDGRSLFTAAVEAGLAGEDIGDLLDDPSVEVAHTEDDHAELRVEQSSLLYLRRDPDPEVDADAGAQAPWRVDLPGLIEALGPSIEALAKERVETSGKLRTALYFVALRLDVALDPAILDGPLR
ncbi:hypothetical protein [Plesiocystis pacifica]|uniref:hypothetical protein n=1 Tax=Plesiocystis pacifica TaxID=191768 RepID=UPI0012FC808B|nr:hypothetical protein [Plesiocystis pacifica]